MIEDATKELDTRFRKLFNDSFEIEISFAEMKEASERDKIREAERMYQATLAAGGPVGPGAARDLPLILVSELCPRQVSLDVSSDTIKLSHAQSICIDISGLKE